MRLIQTSIPDVVVVEAEPRRDERGYFARTFDDAIFAERGIHFVTRQCSTSFNDKRGTLRGLHFQLPPTQEIKLVRCTRGAVFDVSVDLRPGSPTFRQWFGLELAASNVRALVIPRGCAHGFLTLTDASEILYQIDAPYSPELGRGVRWNDPAFAISWPFEPKIISASDATLPDFTP